MKTASIYNDLEYNENGNAPNICLMMTSHLGKEIRISFRKGQYMKEHFTPSPILIEVYEGEVELGAEQEIKTLKKGDMASLAGEIRHDITALEDSIVKLSLHKNDSYKSIKDFVKH